MIAIIPDTNVILAATFNITYEEIISLQHKFHEKSSELLDLIKDDSNVNGIFLPKVEEESLEGVFSVFNDLRTVTLARQIVRDVAREIARKVAKRIRKNYAEAKTLEYQYLEIIFKNHSIRDPSKISKFLLGTETPREIVYLRNLYSVLPVIYVDWKKFKQKIKQENKQKSRRARIEFVLDCASECVPKDEACYDYNTSTEYRFDRLVEYSKEELWNVIKSEIRHVELDYSSTKTAKKYYSLQMGNLLDDLVRADSIHDAEKSWYANNETAHVSASQLVVKELFENLITKHKDKPSPQVAKHIESEVKDKHSHDLDKLILSQAVIYKKSVNSKYKIYIASNDTRFFSSYKGDSTITDAIRDKFGIICGNPKEICDTVFPNSNYIAKKVQE